MDCAIGRRVGYSESLQHKLENRRKKKRRREEEGEQKEEIGGGTFEKGRAFSSCGTTAGEPIS